jgi:HEXXH motif-containing protein
MTTATLPFTFPPIQRLHAERTGRIHALLKGSPAPAQPTRTAALSYAFAHHALEGAENAARAKNKDLFAWYRQHPDAGGTEKTTASTAGPSVILDLDQDQLQSTPISETPYHLLGPSTVTASDSLRAATVTARSLAADTGFGDLLADHAAVICLLNQRALGETLSSWTISRLPGTLFCDHVGDPVVLARDFIHEAGHNWLNDALSATGSTLDDTETFYSPWKQSQRPAFGFLHACWAFPLTVIYTARVIDRCGGALHDYLTAYLDKQRAFLADTADDHDRALHRVEDQSLAARLRDVHSQALAL